MEAISVRKRKKRPKSHVGRMEGAHTAPGGSGKIDTRLTPVHRYTLANWYTRAQGKGGFQQVTRK